MPVPWRSVATPTHPRRTPRWRASSSAGSSSGQSPGRSAAHSAPSAFARTIPSVAASEWPWSVGSRSTSNGVRLRFARSIAIFSARPSPVTRITRSISRAPSSATRTSASIARRTAARPGGPMVSTTRVFARANRLMGRMAVAFMPTRGSRSASARRPSGPLHEGGADERLESLGRRVGVALVDDDPVEEPLIERGDSGGADRAPDRRHERLGRPLDRPARHERAHGDHASGGLGDRLAHARNGEDRADRDHGVRRADHDQISVGDGGEHLGRRARLGEAFDLDSLDRSLAVVDDQELLKAAPAGGRRGCAVRTGSSHIGRTPASTPSPRAIWPWAAVSVPPSAMKWVR